MNDYFGLCPECGSEPQYLNVGKGHWCYCPEHRIRWFIGSNLFSSWRHETEAEQRAEYEALDFGSYGTIDIRDTACQQTNQETTRV